MRILVPAKLGAALGASRAGVDASYASNDWQVGQTGKIVAPQMHCLRLILRHPALGGMNDSKVIGVIKTDPETRTSSVLDFGLEVDLFAAVPDLVQAL